MLKFLKNIKKYSNTYKGKRERLQLKYTAEKYKKILKYTGKRERLQLKYIGVETLVSPTLLLKNKFDIRGKGGAIHSLELLKNIKNS